MTTSHNPQADPTLPGGGTPAQSLISAFQPTPEPTDQYSVLISTVSVLISTVSVLISTVSVLISTVSVLISTVSVQDNLRPSYP